MIHLCLDSYKGGDSLIAKNKVFERYKLVDRLNCIEIELKIKRNLLNTCTTKVEYEKVKLDIEVLKIEFTTLLNQIINFNILEG